jgi:hypothetical protein
MTPYDIMLTIRGYHKRLNDQLRIAVNAACIPRTLSDRAQRPSSILGESEEVV